MQPFKLIRSAAVIAALLAIGHTLGAPWIPAHGDRAASISQSMKTTSFHAMGTDRTLWEFYVGFGATLSVYLLTNAVLLWQLGTIAKDDAARGRPLLLTLALSSIAGSVVITRFFFAAPIVLSLGVALCAVAAYLQSRRRVEHQRVG
jgi:hypothetical protein